MNQKSLSNTTLIYKTVNDQLYGVITLSKLSVQIIDTPEYQRLRNIKQLGVCSYIFPSANHSRFEHSLGVSHLAKELIYHLKNIHQNNVIKLNITDDDILCLEIAGLCHDLGHGPYSHLFEDYFLKGNPNIDNIINKSHEIRSVNLLKYIIDKYNILITDEQYNKIKKMIIPEETDNFIYQIISNKKSGIDVDKMDYIIRDTYKTGFKFSIDINRIIKNCRIINDNLCFNIKEAYNINELFITRFRLHKQLYHNSKVKAIEFIICDILKKMDDYLKITNNLDDHEFFCKLDDNIIHICKWVPIPEVSHLLNLLETRQIPKMISEDKKAIQSKSTENLNMCMENYLKVDTNNYTFKQEIIISLNGNLDVHPISRILFYDKNSNESYYINPEEVSIFNNDNVGQKIIRYYV